LRMTVHDIISEQCTPLQTDIKQQTSTGLIRGHSLGF